MAIFQNIYNVTDWIRPADWLPIDHLISDGQQGIVGLYAVFPSTETYYNNMVAFTNRGSTIVDWGDGNIENVADNVKAEHIYDYDSIPDSTLCSRGYKQVIITITSANVLYNVSLCGLHSNSDKFFVDSCNWLDIKMSFTGLISFKMAALTYMSYPILLEKIVMYQSTNKLTNLNTSFTNCTNLAYCDLNGLNTENVTTMSSAFANCASLKTLLISNWNTGNVADMTYMFSNIVYEDLDLSNFSTNSGKVVGIGAMFMYANLNKITLGALRIDGSITNTFYVCTAKEIDISRIISFTPNTSLNTFDGATVYLSRLKSFDFSKINATKITSVAAMLANTRLLNECIFTDGYFTNCSNASGFVTTSGGSLKKLRMPKLIVSINIAAQKISGTDMNLLFGDLSDLNGAINTHTVYNSGTGYGVGDIITITGGNNDATFLVTSIGTNGSVGAGLLFYDSRGTGYSVANQVSSTSNGAGTGFMINITGLRGTQTITITGNPAVTDPVLDITIAQNKNWTVAV